MDWSYCIPILNLNYFVKKSVRTATEAQMKLARCDRNWHKYYVLASCSKCTVTTVCTATLAHPNDHEEIPLQKLVQVLARLAA